MYSCEKKFNVLLFLQLIVSLKAGCIFDFEDSDRFYKDWEPCDESTGTWTLVDNNMFGKTEDGNKPLGEKSIISEEGKPSCIKTKNTFLLEERNLITYEYHFYNQTDAFLGGLVIVDCPTGSLIYNRTKPDKVVNHWIRVAFPVHREYCKIMIIIQRENYFYALDYVLIGIIPTDLPCYLLTTTEATAETDTDSTYSSESSLQTESTYSTSETTDTSLDSADSTSETTDANSESPDSTSETTDTSLDSADSTSETTDANSESPDSTSETTDTSSESSSNGISEFTTYTSSSSEDTTTVSVSDQTSDNNYESGTTPEYSETTTASSTTDNTERPKLDYSFTGYLYITIITIVSISLIFISATLTWLIILNCFTPSKQVKKFP